VFALGVQILLLFLAIGAPILFVLWFAGTVRAIARRMQSMDNRLASIQRALSDRSMAALPNGR
jgi:hypothetical protein